MIYSNVQILLRQGPLYDFEHLLIAMCLRVFKSGYLIVFWSAAGVYLILSVGDLMLVFGSFETQNIYQIRKLLSSKYVRPKTYYIQVKKFKKYKSWDQCMYLM